MYSKHNMILVNIQLWKNFPKNRAVYYEDHYNKNKKNIQWFYRSVQYTSKSPNEDASMSKKKNKANEWKKKTR